MGFLIDSPTLAAELHRHFDTSLPAISYRPELLASGSIAWHETTAHGSEIVHDREPGATLVQRFAIIVIGVLPVEWLL